MTRRLIEDWLPIAALSEESVRERRSMTALPPIYYLHVWWARRPLVASRAAVLASLLPASADREKFLHVVGIHGDPVAAKHRIARADRAGERLGKDAYGYPRAFTYQPTNDDLTLLEGARGAVVLDPTAGGGAIPLEASRLGLATYANDLNPVAATILTGTLDAPRRFGASLVEEFSTLGVDFRRRVKAKLAGTFPDEPEGKTRPDGYLWARTISCPYCDGLVPLSPNWRLSGDGIGVRLRPHLASGPGSAGRICRFEIVESAAAQSEGTVSDGVATCPYPDCGRVIDGDEVKRQAQAGVMGEQLYVVVAKRQVVRRTKTGKTRLIWERFYRAPRAEDDNSAAIAVRLAAKLPEWEALDIVPNDRIDVVSNYDRGHRMYGMEKWIDVFSPRQLLVHGLAVETFRDMVEEDRGSGRLNNLRRAAFVYLSFSLDKLRDYNSKMTRWIIQREVMANTFDSHNFAMKWSYTEMAVMVEGLGFDWAIGQTAKCIGELVELTAGSVSGPLFAVGDRNNSPPVTITAKPGAALDHIADASVDAVVMDPPYGANVMYAELSDFFYVWLKRTAGLVEPGLFRRRLTDKDQEAVANKARFKGKKGADALATRDYQDKMAAIFAECRRVLKPDGIMTVMFTHKDVGAWDALTMGLIEAGFVITASWPVNTEAEGSLHIKDKAAANSTIFLVCRPRETVAGTREEYWEDVEPLVAKAVRSRIEEFQKSGLAGVDLYLASFGPALEVFSRHWPLKRGQPRPEAAHTRRRRQAVLDLFAAEHDPHAATPEDALMAARQEVKAWRLNKLTRLGQRATFDSVTSWFVLAWDAFRAPTFAYDEGLRLARAVGADLEGQLVGRVCGKKGANLTLWDSEVRAAKAALGPTDGSRAMIDAIHHAARRARTVSMEAAEELLRDAGLHGDPLFLAPFEALLEVLPPSRSFIRIDVALGEAKGAADDFDALEKLRRIAFSDRVDEPEQLKLFRDVA